MAAPVVVEKRYTVSPEQAAHMLGLSRKAVLRLIRAGKIKASKLTASTIRIRVADLEAYLEACRRRVLGLDDDAQERYSARLELLKHADVYVIRNERSGLIKIGSSRNPAKRLATLQGNCGDTLSLVFTLDGVGADAEEALHFRFEDSRERGEWYRPTLELLAWMEEVQRG